MSDNTTDATNSAVTAGDTDSGDMHATQFTYFFENDSDMDFNFGNMVLGATANHGAAVGEAFYAASQIIDGNASSWQKEWYELAKRVEARGEKSLSQKHYVSACEQLQRAANYYRFSILSILPDDSRLEERANLFRSVLKKAGSLLQPALEYIEIPFEDVKLPGYFRKAESHGEPTKTLVMIGGGETFIEDLYFYIATEAFARGYNFLTVDLPGQGILPLKNKFFRPDMNVPMKAVIDYAVNRPDVDPMRLAAYGMSGGGGFVPQAAMHDPRIRAIAMNSAIQDAEPIFAAMPVTNATSIEMDSWTSFHRNLVKGVCWRWDVSLDKPSELIEANHGFTFDPAKIQVPALIVVGEGEYKNEEIKRQQQYCINNFPNPMSKLVITPADEGGTNHCVMENRALNAQVLFDWLDRVFPAD